MQDLTPPVRRCTAVILPEADATAAMNIAERLRAGVERQPFGIAGGKTLGITVSIGVATYPQQVDSLEGLVKAADAALYAAKQGGRNRMCLYEPEMASLLQTRADVVEAAPSPRPAP